MRPLVLVLAASLSAACGHGSDSAKGGAGSAIVAMPVPASPSAPVAAASAPAAPSPAASAPAAPSAPEAHVPGATAAAQVAQPAPAPDLPGGHDFTSTALALVAVGACGHAPMPEGFSAAIVAKHCSAVTRTRDEYKSRWVTRARPFFAEKVPADVPKKVVYPFAGGDLSTALTVYPDADEITTMSLEPAGDPRTLAVLGGQTGKKASAALEKALATIQYELRFLYRVNFSNTLNMIEAMRGGALPTQLVFGLSALEVHGFEVVSLRYFRLAEDGAIEYLADEDVASAPDPASSKAEARNRLFANAEIRFRKPGGRTQIYRHIQVNLADSHLAKDPRVIKHLEAKGPVAGMTKAASYLLSWPGFSTIRDYLTGHVVWMVSDATGVAPKFGTRAGFEYETYGAFAEPHINAGTDIAANWRALWASQPKRKLPFRFGYHDGSPQHTNHLVIMRKAR